MILILIIAIGIITAAVILIDLYLTTRRLKQLRKDNDKWKLNINEYKHNKNEKEEERSKRTKDTNHDDINDNKGMQLVDITIFYNNFSCTKTAILYWN